MNQYFLLIAILQCFPQLTPVNPLSTWVPLILIFTVYIPARGESWGDVAGLP